MQSKEEDTSHQCKNFVYCERYKNPYFNDASDNPKCEFANLCCRYCNRKNQYAGHTEDCRNRDKIVGKFKNKNNNKEPSATEYFNLFEIKDKPAKQQIKPSMRVFISDEYKEARDIRLKPRNLDNDMIEQKVEQFGGETIKVLSLNMLYSKYAQRYNTTEQINNSNNLENKWNRIADLCNFKDYDIICLQECDRYPVLADETDQNKLKTEISINGIPFEIVSSNIVSEKNKYDYIVTLYNKNKFEIEKEIVKGKITNKIRTAFIFKVDKIEEFKKHPVLTVYLKDKKNNNIKIAVTNLHVPGGGNRINDQKYPDIIYYFTDQNNKQNIADKQPNNYKTIKQLNKQQQKEKITKLFKKDFNFDNYFVNKGYKNIIDMNKPENYIYIRCGDHNRDFFKNEIILVNGLTYNKNQIITEPSKDNILLGRQIDYILTNLEEDVVTYKSPLTDDNKVNLFDYTDHLPITAEIPI